MISRRGWLALGSAAGALLLGAYTLNILILAGAVACFAALAAELLGFHVAPPTPAEFPFEATRSDTPHAASPGSTFTVEVVVKYVGERPFVAEVCDLLPRSLVRVAGRPSQRRRWVPGETVRLRYGLRATNRGSHVLGPIAVIVDSPHQLGWVEWTIPSTARPVRVVPPAPVARTHRLAPAMLTRVQGRLSLRHRGFGTEFRSLRPYQLDDDLRHVAWKRSRPGQWYVREFEQENRQDFLLLLDITPGMMAGLPGENALDRAVEAAALVVAAVARTGEDRVGLLTHTDKVRQYLRPERGEVHFRRIAENLAYLRSRPGEFDLPAALEFCTRRLARNAHVLVFSAMDGPLDQLPPAHTKFRERGHRAYVFPPNRAQMYRDIDAANPAITAWKWAGAEESASLQRSIAKARSEGIPAFPYDRRGATVQVLSTYARLRAWGLA
ncbi:MAG TPA: DUF58 domain-containing protein [Thermoplasmata archaeon]|nr:DUF58 domain-containing protein [Thermoplasmata archaeon]